MDMWCYTDSNLSPICLPQRSAEKRLLRVSRSRFVR